MSRFSLFFIDRVANYTASDGLIRRIFDEEFERLKGRFPFYAGLTAQEVRSAYFAQWASPTFVDTRLRYIRLLLTTGLLKGFRAEITQRRVQPTPIITRFDVEEKIGSRLLSGLIDTMMYSLALQGSEEALHRGIVIPTPDAVHAGLEAMSLQHRLVLLVSVLAALIGVMNETRHWLSLLEGHLQRLDGQRTGHPLRHCPADNAARAQIQDGGQVEPPFQSRDVSDVGQPLLIRLFGGKVPFQQVGSHGMGLVALGGRLESPFMLGPDVIPPHQARNPVLTALPTQRQERVIDAWAAIGLVVITMDDLDLLQELSIRHLSLAGRPGVPGVVATARHLQHLAHAIHWQLTSILFDELESHLFGCEKMATAFFRMSRSCLTISNSRCRCRSSSSAAGMRPWPGNGVFPLGFTLALPPVQAAPGNAQIVFNLTGALARGLP